MKSHFLTNLDVRRVTDKDWTLIASLDYWSAKLGRQITVPAGFTTDFASVPRLPFAYAIFGNLAQEESVIHDLLYRRNGGVTRAQADAVFLEAMEVMGKPWYVRWPMYLGVRAGGWKSFHKKG